MAPSATDKLNGMSKGINDARPNGNSIPNGRPQDHADVRIPYNDQYAFTPRKLRVVTIGAGFSGLLMAHKFQHRFPEMQEYVEHTILERHSDIGGTVSSASQRQGVSLEVSWHLTDSASQWLVNTYPGVQCDVPSHIYVRTSLVSCGCVEDIQS